MGRTKFTAVLICLISGSCLMLGACDDAEPETAEDLLFDFGTKPDSLPTFAEIGLYSAESPWNTPIPDNPDLAPNSAALITSLEDDGNFLMVVKNWSTPVYIADAATPREEVDITCGPYWEIGVSTLTDVPIPDAAEPSWDGDAGDPYPYGCGEGSDQDNHMVILDLENRCEYDFWQARNTTSGWRASWANSISLDSDGIYPHGLSTRGSGFAFLGGVIWPDELRQGRIDHALAFAYPFTKSGGPVAPATDSDGEIDQANAIPEGALLQLDPDLDLGSLNLTSYEMTIAVALQEYGMYLADNSSNGIGLYAVEPKSVSENPYAGILPDEDWVDLNNIPLDAFRVLEMGPQNGNFQDELELVDSGCAVFE